ncbi:hypothetical protein CANARDRAFT_28350 [[Candida] arabinofermentans NRRL YB-2248]|uniref:Protein transport protein SEC31 n=1 Tax=[Candida] arabinofermentans NRRL YB-2248 TaxID=983967 RepID=A0A1E4T1G3_9ASCO|nr:hypothetical protein CANARDRAFT_28350 [[Candida] arabinofermentans NRRL YB-2248]
MVKLNEFNETATFAWSHDPMPLMATGTLAGAMDVTFSSESSLKIYDPFDSTSKPLAQVSVDSKFNSIAWSNPVESHERGLLAAALEDSSIHLWDAHKLIEKNDLKSASVAEYKKHTGPVLQVKFNPLQHHILASSGHKGEIFIWDTKKGTSFTPGQAISPMDKVSSLAWNNSMSHIFASAGNTNYTSIWDLKAKREVLQLSYSGSNLSVVEWHPSQSTKLVTASNTDSNPVILTWDLRNANAPEMVMKGHSKGILSLDWCKQDPNLLLSSGTDDSTFLWNPVTGQKLCNYPSIPNWVHETRFAPKIPDVFASASFDKKIVIQSLQDTSPPVSTKVQSSNEDDFWNQLSTTDTQQPEFIVKQAPAWLARPVSARFGFGSKLVMLKTEKNSSKIIISKVQENEFIEKAAKSLTSAIQSKNYKEICGDNFTETLTDKNSADWKLLKELLESDSLTMLKTKLDLTEEEPKPETNGDDSKETSLEDDGNADDFFSSLGSEVKRTAKLYSPKGEFKLFNNDGSDFENKVIDKILSGKQEEALDLCISNDSITEALIISLSGTEQMREKAKEAYFSKFAPGSSLSRVLYSVSNQDVLDIVENADLSSWKKVVSSVISYCKDPAAFSTAISKLGDRLFESSEEDARENAITCYIAGGSLDKLSNIWLEELPEIEAEYMKSSDSTKTPAEARFNALGAVVGKIMTYQSTVSTDANSPSFISALKEYANLLADAGHFEIAYLLLEKVPDTVQGVKLDKERLAKVLNISASANNAAANNTPASTAAGKRATTAYSSTNKPKGYPGVVPPFGQAPTNQFAPVQPVTPQPSSNPYAPPAAAQSFVPSSSLPPNPYKPAMINSPAANPPTAISPMIPNGTPTMTPPPSIPAPARNFIPSASNPYAPRTALDSLKLQQSPNLVNASIASSTTPGANVLPPMPNKSAASKDVGGWNDLPASMSAQPAKRPPQASIPSAFSYQAAHDYHAQQQASASVRPPSRTASQPPSMPAPPRSVSRNSSIRPQTTQAPVPARSNKYGPPPAALSPAQSPFPPQPQHQDTPPSTRVSSYSNPYAPKPEVDAPIRVPVGHTNISQAAPSSPAPPQPRNPYAPRNDAATTTFTAPQPPQNFSAPPPPRIAESFTPPAPSPYQSVTPSSIPPPPKVNSPLPPSPATSVSLQSPLPPKASIVAAPTTAKKYPAGDRSHIPSSAIPVYEILSSSLEKVKPKIPEKFKKHLADAEKRIGLLFDHLNNEDLLSETTVAELLELCKALDAGDYATAKTLKTKIATEHIDECGNWMVGVDRLISMVEATST